MRYEKYPCLARETTALRPTPLWRELRPGRVPPPIRQSARPTLPPKDSFADPNEPPPSQLSRTGGLFGRFQVCDPAFPGSGSADRPSYFGRRARFCSKRYCEGVPSVSDRRAAQISVSDHRGRGVAAIWRCSRDLKALETIRRGRRGHDFGQRPKVVEAVVGKDDDRYA